MSHAGDIQIEGRWAGVLTRRPNHEEQKSEGTESNFTLYTKDEDGKIEIHGEGNGRLGIFKVKGHVYNGTEVKLVKSYPTWKWHQEGRIDPKTNIMYGRWGKAEQKVGRGYFAFHLTHNGDVETSAVDRLEAITGAWSGTYTTPTSTTSCTFKLIGGTSKGDDQLVIKGNSVSPTPQYTIKGVVSASGQVIFAKVTDSHAFVYRGTLSEGNDSMSGEWAGDEKHGTFHFRRA